MGVGVRYFTSLIFWGLIIWAVVALARRAAGRPRLDRPRLDRPRLGWPRLEYGGKAARGRVPGHTGPGAQGRTGPEAQDRRGPGAQGRTGPGARVVRPGSPWRDNDPEEILSRRYAAGEIDAEEYRQRLEVLRAQRHAAGPDA